MCVYREQLNLVLEIFEGKSLYKWLKTDLTLISNKEREVQIIFR